MPPENALAEYAESNSDTAFRALAEQYSGLVYASALRRTGNRQASEEIVQNVFVALARKAKRLTSHPALSAWLYRATMLESANYLRRESKRAIKMAEYQVQQIDVAPEDGEPLPNLDAAIDRLPSADRSLVLLRYFDGKSYREIGEALGKTEAACRKQAERALQKLARVLRARGVTATAAVIASALGSQLSEAAPVGVSAVAAEGSGIAAKTAAAGGIAAVVMGVFSKPKVLVACAVAVVGVVAVVVQQKGERDAGRSSVAGGDTSEIEKAGMPSAIPMTTNNYELDPEDFETLNLTPTGICEAVRAGDLDLVKRMLAEKPELLTATNPGNWAHLKELRVHPWAARPVELATIFGHAEMVTYLLGISETDYGGDLASCYYESLEIAQKMENPAVLAAVENDFIRRITDEPQLITFTEKNGSSILHFAAGHSNLRLMGALLERGADPEVATDRGRKAIHYVIGDNEQTRLLLEHGADFNLWVAAALGDLERAREILSADPNQVAVDFHPASIHSNGMPLVAAAAGGKLEMVRLLLEHGADVDGKLPGREFADMGLGLWNALNGGHLDVVHLLLDHDADVEAWVDSNWSFKYKVKELGDRKLMERVFTEEELAAKPDSPAFEAWTGEIVGDIRQLPPQSPEDSLGTIRGAIVSHNRHNDYANYKEIITVMLEQGADQNAAMDPVSEEEKVEALKKRYWHREYGTPLHWLSTAYLNKANYSPNPAIPTREELVDLAGLFLEFDANIEARHPISNHTPLSSAVREGIEEYVAFLLENGAVVNRDDPPETNPVAIAEKLGFKKILGLLRGR